MKKIVTANGYGGFTVSQQALVMLHFLGFPLEQRPLAETGYKDVHFFREGSLGFKGHNDSSYIMKDGVVYSLEILGDDLRSHPALVTTVETLGELANGEMCELRIVEVEDDLLYRIKNHDGYESVELYSPNNYTQGYSYVSMKKIIDDLEKPIEFTEVPKFSYWFETKAGGCFNEDVYLPPGMDPSSFEALRCAVEVLDSTGYAIESAAYAPLEIENHELLQKYTRAEIMCKKNQTI